MSNLTLYFTDRSKDPIIVNNRGFDFTTSQRFSGFGTRNYAQSIGQAFLNLVENWAGPEAPIRPIEGQLWYNTNTTDLLVYTATTDSPPVYEWEVIGSMIVSTVQPSIVYKLWYNPTTSMLMVYNGSSYESVGVLYFHLDGDDIPGNIITGQVTVTGNYTSGGSVAATGNLNVGNLYVGRDLYVDGTLSNDTNANNIVIRNGSGHLIVQGITDVTFKVASSNTTTDKQRSVFSMVHTSGDVTSSNSLVFSYYNQSATRYETILNAGIVTSQKVINVPTGSFASTPSSLVPYSELTSWITEISNAILRASTSSSNAITLSSTAPTQHIAFANTSTSNALLAVSSGGFIKIGHASALTPTAVIADDIVTGALYTIKNNTTTSEFEFGSYFKVASNGDLNVNGAIVSRVADLSLTAASNAQSLINKKKADEKFQPYAPPTRGIPKGWAVINFSGTTPVVVHSQNLVSIVTNTSTKVVTLTFNPGVVAGAGNDCILVTSAAGLHLTSTVPGVTETVKCTPVVGHPGSANTLTLLLKHIRLVNEPAKGGAQYDRFTHQNVFSFPSSTYAYSDGFITVAVYN